MKGIYWFISLLMLMIFFVVPISAYAQKYEQKLEQDWIFYNEQLVQKEEQATRDFVHVNLPIEFDDLTPNQPSGYGTFIKTIEVPKAFVNKTLGLELPFTYSASKVYINGEFYKEIGTVSNDATIHKRDLQTVVIPIKTQAEKLEIAIQISSFNHIRGGFSSAPKIGDWDTIHNAFEFNHYLVIFVVAIIFIAGMTTLIIGLLSRNEKLFFVFGLFALTVALRGIVAAPFLYHELPFHMSYELATRLEYFTTNTCFALYAIFVYLLYNKLFSKWILYPCVIILATLAIMAIFANIVTFQSAFFAVFPVMLTFVIYNIWIICRAFFSKLMLAKSLLFGVLFVLTGLIIDFLTGMGVINVPPLANFMIAMNVFLVLFSLCNDYVKYTNTVTKLNNQLDQEVRARTIQLNRANTELQNLVNQDSLTGIYNRHKFKEAIMRLFNEAEKNKTPLSLIMIDLDEFKKYNDYYGHPKGDELLIRLSALLNSFMPEDAIFARYGGEEFIVILPNCSLIESMVFAEHLRKQVEENYFEHLGRSEKQVTVSIGVAEKIQDRIHTEGQLIQLADERLYASKANGRNRITTM